MQPNIIVFMTDQQNASTIQSVNITKTPNIDEFLKSSVQFNNAYCPSPHCCPSRATFFTGLYPSQHGVWNNVEVDNAVSRGLYDGVKVFPEILKQNGYHTVFSGKWHVSAVEGPEKRGFDEVLNLVSTNFGLMKNDNKPKANEWEKVYAFPNKLDSKHEEKVPGRIIKEGYPKYYQYGINENPFGDSTSVELACEKLLDYDSKEPLFMYVGTTGPHDPYFVPQRFLNMYKDTKITLPDNFSDDMLDKPALYRRTKEQFALSREEHIESLRHYMAFVSYQDYLFGKVLKTVKEKHMEDNTIILYLTDHGDYCGAHGLWSKGLPCFKEAYNICAVIGGMGIEKNKKIDDLVSLADIAPTIIDLAGIENPIKMTGKSLKGFLTGDNPKHFRDYIFTQTNGNEIYGIQRAVFDKKWKYVYDSFDYDELYDLENDPLELQNVASKEENKPIIRKMCKEMWKFAKETKDSATNGYIMVRLAPFGPGIVNEDDN